MKIQQFPVRTVMLKESTAEELQRFDVRHARVDEKTEMPPLPQNFSIRNEMTAVEDQGGQGSCTAFCVVACLEHLHRRDLSEGGVNHEAEKAYSDCSAGLAAVHAFQLCKATGAVDESLWRYDETQVCWTTPPNVAAAARYRFNDFGYVYQRPRPALKERMAQLASGRGNVPAMPGLPLSLAVQQQLFSRRRPVAVSVPVVWAAWPWDGNITMPSPAGVGEFIEAAAPGEAGWHCIAVCGWDNATGRFLFKNSWGAWGNAGYGTIPYQYLEMYSDIALVGW